MKSFSMWLRHFIKILGHAVSKCKVLMKQKCGFLVALAMILNKKELKGLATIEKSSKFMTPIGCKALRGSELLRQACFSC